MRQIGQDYFAGIDEGLTEITCNVHQKQNSKFHWYFVSILIILYKNFPHDDFILTYRNH